jgi:hypothetical protein
LAAVATGCGCDTRAAAGCATADTPAGASTVLWWSGSIVPSRAGGCVAVAGWTPACWETGARGPPEQCGLPTPAPAPLPQFPAIAGTCAINARPDNQKNLCFDTAPPSNL